MVHWIREWFGGGSAGDCNTAGDCNSSPCGPFPGTVVLQAQGTRGDCNTEGDSSTGTPNVTFAAGFGPFFDTETVTEQTNPGYIERVKKLEAGLTELQSKLDAFAQQIGPPHRDDPRNHTCTGGDIIRGFYPPGQDELRQTAFVDCTASGQSLLGTSTYNPSIGYDSETKQQPALSTILKRVEDLLSDCVARADDTFARF